MCSFFLYFQNIPLCVKQILTTLSHFSPKGWKIKTPSSTGIRNFYFCITVIGFGIKIYMYDYNVYNIWHLKNDGKYFLIFDGALSFNVGEIIAKMIKK